jgi:hypothetical protein
MQNVTLTFSKDRGNRLGNIVGLHILRGRMRGASGNVLSIMSLSVRSFSHCMLLHNLHSTTLKTRGTFHAFGEISVFVLQVA